MKCESLSRVRLFVTSWTVAPGSSVPGILQTRILEWVAISSSRGIFLTQGSYPDLPHYRQIIYHLNHQGSSRSQPSELQVLQMFGAVTSPCLPVLGVREGKSSRVGFPPAPPWAREHALGSDRLVPEHAQSECVGI